MTEGADNCGLCGGSARQGDCAVRPCGATAEMMWQAGFTWFPTVGTAISGAIGVENPGARLENGCNCGTGRTGAVSMASEADTPRLGRG